MLLWIMHSTSFYSCPSPAVSDKNGFYRLFLFLFFSTTKYRDIFWRENPLKKGAETGSSLTIIPR